MKKLAGIILCCAMLTAALGTVVGASTPNEDLLGYVKEKLPSSYTEIVYPQVEKIVNQIEVTAEQVTAEKTIIDDVVATVSDKGISLHTYSASEQSYLLGKFAEAVNTLGLTYKLQTKTTDQKHSGDQVAYIYKGDVLLGTIDGDVSVAKTDTAVSSASGMILVAAGALAVVGVVAASKNRKHSFA